MVSHTVTQKVTYELFSGITIYDESGKRAKVRIKCNDGVQEIWVHVDLQHYEEFRRYLDELNKRFS